MTELISDEGQTWAVPAIADALSDMFKKDPNWSLFADGGHKRFGDGQGDDRLCPECGELWGFIWMYMWVNRTVKMWANIDSFYCPNSHRWTVVCVPPVDIGDSGFSGVRWAVA
ncbi:hypothetical protein A5724_21420 [Mycobacterium sp. ACS1612]|uniref:hypothetical protein n=1 Tax=Mycobacterium sp. ACS1612 TaxID=1834117 RepID=UPI0007FECEF7|nr:hypothetical protein [Mycobacterium sp. ACS1612]OBF31539.1 hypothetical protein A5724_21420 [Mycobacterium sp. ACS1612]